MGFIVIFIMILAVTLFSGCSEKNPPVAQIQETPTKVMIGESITFSAAGSSDANGNITSYEWDFGDGNAASGVTVSHAWPEGGNYDVKLTVTDNDSLSDTAEVNVNVLIGVTIKLKTTSYSCRWPDGRVDFDIYNVTKEKLEAVGFEVVPEESDSFDATLFVTYEELNGAMYTSGVRGYIIRCNLELLDKADNLLLKKYISASTPYYVRSNQYYYEAIKSFSNCLYFKYLGNFIAVEFGVGDEVSVMISALEEMGSFADYTEQREVIIELSRTKDARAEALRNIGDKRAVEPLRQLSKDEFWARDEVTEALEKINNK